MKAVANPNGSPKVLWADLGGGQMVAMIALVFIQIVYVTMVYGPIAAFLWSSSDQDPVHVDVPPVHLGNGWFGGFLPLIATAVTSSAVAKEAFGGRAMFAACSTDRGRTRDARRRQHLHQGNQGPQDRYRPFNRRVAEPRFDWTAVLLAIAGATFFSWSSGRTFQRSPASASVRPRWARRSSRSSRRSRPAECRRSSSASPTREGRR